MVKHVTAISRNAGANPERETTRIPSVMEEVAAKMKPPINIELDTVLLAKENPIHLDTVTTISNVLQKVTDFVKKEGDYTDGGKYGGKKIQKKQPSIDISITMKEFGDLFAWLIDKANEELRDPEMQAIWELMQIAKRNPINTGNSR